MENRWRVGGRLAGREKKCGLSGGEATVEIGRESLKRGDRLSSRLVPRSPQSPPTPERAPRPTVPRSASTVSAHLPIAEER